MTRRTILILVVLTLAMLGLNVIAWQPGVGSRHDKEPGTELERYFGWPATYKAELWQSDDPSLVDRILSVAPFYWPQKEMQLANRYFGGRAVTINTLFWLLSFAIVVLFSLRAGRFAHAILGLLAGLGLLVCLWIAPTVSVHL